MISPGELAKMCVHAACQYPFEAVGLLCDGYILPCENAAHNRRTSFRIEPSELRRIERRHTIAGIYHSHVDCDGKPSGTDLIHASYFGCPYIVIEIRKGVAVAVNAYVLEGPANKRFRPAPELITG